MPDGVECGGGGMSASGGGYRSEGMAFLLFTFWFFPSRGAYAATKRRRPVARYKTDVIVH